MLVLALILILCGVFAVWLWRKPRHQLPPTYPGSLPFIGILHMIPSDPIDAWNLEKKIYEFTLKSGGVTVINIFTERFYVITDPDDSLYVANTCLAKPYFYNGVRDVFNKGLLTANVSAWKPHRKLLNPAFNQQVLNSFLDVFNEQARVLVTELAVEAGKDSFDMEMYLSNCLIKTSCETTLGLKTDEDNSMVGKYSWAIKALSENFYMRMMKIWLHPQIFFNLSSLKKKQDSLLKTLKNISSEVIRRKLETKQTSNCVGDAAVPDKIQPLFDRMLYLADTQDAFTVDEIQDHVNLTIAAAYDTTSKGILFALILIGSHENVQARIIKEYELTVTWSRAFHNSVYHLLSHRLNEVLEGEDRNVNKFDLQKLVYLEAVIKETLRLYPPAPRFGRYIDSDVKLKNYTLLAGSNCVISIHAINRHPMWGADADQFRPERWLDPASLPDNPNTFASFSLGRRNCIGKTYAMMVMKTTLVHMLRHYHITSSSHNLQTRCDVLQTPMEGHEIKIQLRKLVY